MGAVGQIALELYATRIGVVTAGVSTNDKMLACDFESGVWEFDCTRAPISLVDKHGFDRVPSAGQLNSCANRHGVEQGNSYEQMHVQEPPWTGQIWKRFAAFEEDEFGSLK